MKKLYIVIPCYNEELVLYETTRLLEEKIKHLVKEKMISPDSQIVFVNDGSKDQTWEIIQKLHKEHSFVSGINLSRNRGHQNALLAGLLTVKDNADIVISMDADLQDDINAIDEMIKENQKGIDVVYGVRSSRKKDSFFKKHTAQLFYKLMKWFGVDIIYNHADFRLMNQKALNALEGFSEVNLFLRGIIPLIGFKSSIVYYERGERFAGESKYPLSKMLSFAIDGITSFSVRPLRLIFTLGLIILIISIVIMFYSLIVKLLGKTVDGWTFLSISIWFIGGLQMLSIGIIGEYIGKIYHETKRRPRFIIDEKLMHE